MTRDAGIVAICPNVALTLAALVAVLFIAPLGGLAAALFLAAGMMLFLRRFRANLTWLVQDWWILLLPIWCTISAVWSEHPAQSLRYGIQFGLTTVVALAIAARLSPRSLLRTLLVATVLAALASLAFGRARLDGGGYLGIYGSKNAFAQVMSILVIAGLALALGRDGGRGWRLAGLVAVPAGLILVAMAQSAGWMVAALLAVASGVIFALMRRLHPSAKLITVALMALGAAALALVAWARQDYILAVFLDLTGKDVTLTGRTDLWRIAVTEIARHPLIGQGYQAVWVVGNPLAEEIWRSFGIASKTGFHFHNTWLSNAVEIGIIGVAMQAAIFLTALFAALRGVLRSVRADTLFMAMYMIVQTAMSMIEVVGFSQFQLGTMLILIAASQGSRARRGGPAPRRQMGRVAKLGSRSAGVIPAFTRGAWRAD